jgi:flagellar basal-body rod protein FlgG
VRTERSPQRRGCRQIEVSAVSAWHDSHQRRRDYYTAPPKSEIAATDSSVKQGMLESSNVNPVSSMVELITAQRSAEMMQRRLTMFGSEMDKTASQELPKVSLGKRSFNMFHALYTAASGMTAQQINLDNIANNLANASTSGFQSRRVQFSDLLYQSEVMPGSAATQQTTVSSGLQVGLGTRPGNTEIIQTQGDLSSTGNPLDFAIQGTGFFQVLSAQQPDRLHTRRLIPDRMRRATRHRERQRVAAGDYDPCERYQYYRGQRWHSERHSAGTDQRGAGRRDLQLANFANPGGLNSVGNNIYLPTTASGDPVVGTPGGADGLGTIQQGMLEQANVNVSSMSSWQHDSGPALV